jgi:hypothetical protein
VTVREGVVPMGQCIYVAERLDAGKDDLRARARAGAPLVREMPSELWMHPEEAGRTLGKDHLLNTTIGVWFYESDLWDKRALRRRLMALVQHVTSPEFLRDYEEWGREMLKVQRNLRRKRRDKRK